MIVPANPFYMVPIFFLKVSICIALLVEAMQLRTSQALGGRRGQPNVTTKVGPPTVLPTLLRFFIKASLSLFFFCFARVASDWHLREDATRFKSPFGPVCRAPCSRYGMASDLSGNLYAYEQILRL